MKKYLLILFSSYLLLSNSISQTFEWNIGFHGFFDNREYYNGYANDQTIFGSRLFAQGGIAVNNNNRIMAGFNYLYEFGSKGDLIAPDIMVYYKGNKGPVTFYLGAFPRRELINHPFFLLSDTLNYYRPNVEGVFFEFRKPWGFGDIWIDWTGRRSPTKQEQFIIGGSGYLQKGIWFYKHHFIISHFGLPEDATVFDHIRNNGGLTAVLGLDLSSKTMLDTATISTGLALSYDAIRNLYNRETVYGWYSELDLFYKGFGIHGTCYLGENQTLLYGDSFYSSRSYQRIDMFYLSQKIKKVSGKIQFSLHGVPARVDYSFLLTIFVNLEGNKPLNQERLSNNTQ
jgi:hypothetical protein